MAKFPVPPFRVEIFPTDEVRVVNTAVSAFKRDVARDPVTVRLDAVVEPSVDEPLTCKLFAFTDWAAKLPVTVSFETVVLANVEEPETAKFPAERVPLTFDVEALVVEA